MQPTSIDQVLAAATRELQAGRLAQAREILTEVLKRAPEHPGALYLMANVQLRARDFTGSAATAQRAVDASAMAGPGQARPLITLAKARAGSGDHSGAAEAFGRATELDRSAVFAWIGLAHAHLQRGDYDAGERALREGVAANPNKWETSQELALLLMATARAPEAVSVLAAAQRANPALVQIDHLLCHALNYDPTASPSQVFHAHAALGRKVAEQTGDAVASHANTREPGRPIRIGYLSPDLREHSVSYFMSPVLEHHDRQRYPATCYFVGDKSDATTARLRGHATAWRDVAGLGTFELVEQIRRDGIDILVDLCGHTGGQRIDVLARRPAPVMATYLGYPNTTGLLTIDWRIVDGLTDPEDSAGGDSADSLAVEKLARLDGCFLCYRPPDVDIAPSGNRGSEAGASITFGSFNHVRKINESCVRMWAAALKAVPGSTMMLKGDFRADAARRHVLGMFERAGVDPSRVRTAMMVKDQAEHLALYHGVDIALDTFPYHGTTTTCEALWMGVPVVSMAGGTHASRVGLSLLSAVGLGESCATSEDGFVRIAAGLANDHARLAAIRTGLRERLLASPLCDGPAFARKLEAAYRDMWRAWCGAK